MIDLPNIRQTTDYTCGAASLLSVLNYYGLYEDSEMNLAEELESDEEWGTDPTNIIKVAQRYGLSTHEFKSMGIDKLQEFVNGGIPVIVSYQAWSEEEDDWQDCWLDGHYSVVIGVDDELVYFEDPSLGAGEVGYIPKDEFLTRWHDVDRDGNELKQYGLALLYADHPFHFAPMHRIRKID